MRKIIFGVIGLCLLAVPAGATLSDAGTESPFALGAGSRALAMAGAYPAVADDVTSLFWNAAGLGRVEQAEISAMHISLFFDTPYDFLGAAYPILDWGTVAVGAVRIATDGIVLRDESSLPLDSGAGSLDMREYLFGFGRELPFGFSAGTVIKVDQTRLLGNFTSGVGWDLGLQYHLPKSMSEWTQLQGMDWEHVTFGLSLQNLIGSQLRLADSTDVLPLNVSGGVAYLYDRGDSLKQKILISAGVQKSTWQALRLNLGLEYSLWELLAVRAGLRTDEWTAGAGVSSSGLALDYALAGQELGLTHRITLTYRFGPRLREQQQERERLRQDEIDREAGIQAEAVVKRTREQMDKAALQKEKRFRREKQELLANQEKVIADELQRQEAKHQQAMALEYFKSLHYFNGLRDYLKKVYPQAVAEFQTVAKYDPNFLELKFYLDRAQQMTKGKFKIVEENNLKLYYHGIDLYVENRFDEAIQTWKQILASEPANLMVLRNIEDAESRRDALNKAEGVEAVVPLTTLQGKGEALIGEGSGNTVLPAGTGNSGSAFSPASLLEPAAPVAGNAGKENVPAPSPFAPAGVTGPAAPVMEKKP